jgi:hypothetical protein
MLNRPVACIRCVEESDCAVATSGVDLAGADGLDFGGALFKETRKTGADTGARH